MADKEQQYRAFGKILKATEVNVEYGKSKQKFRSYHVTDGKGVDTIVTENTFIEHFVKI